jgi:hypothetical protein
MGERHGSYPSFTTGGRVIGDFQFSELGEIPGTFRHIWNFQFQSC